jgi:hypothetical protein
MESVENPPRKRPKPSFRAYIDESGDEGFVFRSDGGGSSRWFVLTAVVIRMENDLEMVRCMKEAREILKKPPLTHVHFHKLCHHARCAYVKRISRLPIFAVSIMVHKPSLANPDYFKGNGHRLYRYSTRLLMERISRVCEDYTKPGEGDGSVDIIFSNRSSMSYDEIRTYLEQVVSEGDKKSVKMMINPRIILPSQISSVAAPTLAGLQVADAVASSCYYAASVNLYGSVETNYIEVLSRRFFKFENGNVWGRGIKLYPDLNIIKKHAPEISKLEGVF